MVKIPLLPNNVGKKSVNDTGPRQGHDTNKSLKPVAIRLFTNDSALDIIKKIQDRFTTFFKTCGKKPFGFQNCLRKGVRKCAKSECSKKYTKVKKVYK